MKKKKKPTLRSLRAALTEVTTDRDRLRGLALVVVSP